ncbi:scavenger receptor cysteine-rich type 1 protein M130 [Misgurnus anguillicaudatus]|uniref:scavenger receptor cysteine-rich type 1 protein M130 n=1 Tax=Misgurnus anguillicaudatus TaxID=75329 RepID=UPI003CCFC66F
MDGINTCSGRVEIYTDDWGTVCDQDLDSIEGNMICTEAGCGPLQSVKTGAFYGQGTGPLLTDDLNCYGNESAVINCEWDNHTDACDHKHDVSVICEPIVRFVGGVNNCSGRVEIFHNKVWGTICGNSWDMLDAQMACMERGCGNPIATTPTVNYGQGTGQIWMDGLGCTGREASFKNCPFNGWGVTSCTHTGDVSVNCLETRLVDGYDSCSGRVEVLFVNAGWGTVCDNGWNLLGADLICKEMGCGSALNATRGSVFKKGNRKIWTFNTQCTGTEPVLKQCLSSTTPNTCTHNNEAGVICRKIKVAGGPNKCVGTLAVRYNEVWGSICQNSWDYLDGIVACRELGCGPFVQVLTGAAYGQGPGAISLDGLGCTGSESSLSQCSFPGINSICTHSMDAGVSCQGMRLVGGDSVCSGRVEILFNDQWGTVCDDNWDMTDAEVVCRELGCGTAVEAKKGAYFGSGVGQIWKDELRCTGSETSVVNCKANPWGVTDCGHNKDAGVICREVRLVNTINPCKGTVQVLHDGQWGSVCHNNWDIPDAYVLCGELGCGGNAQAMKSAYFGVTTGPIWMDALQCTSGESHLRDCKFGGWGNQICVHPYDAGVICKDIKTVLRIEVASDSVDPNSQDVKTLILQKLTKEIQKAGDLSVRWRILNGIVFQLKSIIDP